MVILYEEWLRAMLRDSRIASNKHHLTQQQLRPSRTIARMSLALFLYSLLVSCGLAPIVGKNNEFYHCVGMNKPSPPPNTFSKSTPLEKFEYGVIKDANRPTTGTWRQCKVMPLPAIAYLRYQVDGHVVEKTFDLSALTPQRVYKKDIEFYVDNEVVEVRLVKLSSGYPASIEVLARF